MSAAGEKTFLGHPIGLSFLFGSEMWERFSYYGMRLLLPLYCLQFLLLPGHHEQVIGFETVKSALGHVYGTLATPQQLQSAIYGAYTALVYATPLVGGWLADRWFGRRYMIVAGGILMAIGHFMMAFDHLFYFALLFLILGNGGFKPNISTQVGGLYKPGDSRIDRAYSVFYFGINTGSFLGQNICGLFGDHQMWSYGFGAAGVGMLIGTVVYLFALRVLPDDRPQRAAAKSRPPLDREGWRAVITLLLLFIPSCLFWATYEQSGNTVEVWTIDSVNRVLNLGFTKITLTVGFIQSLDGIFILAFTPLVITIWKWQARRRAEPSPVVKMALGFVVLSCAYLVLAASQFIAGSGQVHWTIAILYFMALTSGELYFSPVGLSLYSRAAPPQVAAMMMAVFLGAMFPGNFLAGYLGTFYSAMGHAQFFAFIALIAAVPAPIIWAFNGPLKRIMQGHEDRRLQLEDVPYIPKE